MSDSRVPFYTQAAILDEFIQTSDPGADPAMLEIVLQVINEHPELRDYFFRNRPSLGWLPILWNHGFFDHPPSPVPHEQGFLLPRWDVQEYLASVAAQAPDLVLWHIATIDAHPVYIARAVACLTQLPLDQVEEALPRVITWLSDVETANHLQYVIEDLIKVLAQDRRESALDLFEAFIHPFPNPNSAPENSYLKRNEAISIIGENRFQDEEFLAIVKVLSKIDHKALINILERTLSFALDLEVEATESRPHAVRSTWWRPAIEPSGQNWHQHFKDDLIDALRDACEHWANENPSSARANVERYLSMEEAPILRRLGLHLLRSSHGAFSDLVSRELVEPANYDETETHHEFMLLLEEGYQLLSEEDQRRVLDNIQAGPPTDRVEELAVWATTQREEQHENQISKEEYILSYIRHWKLYRLWMIRDHLSGPELDEMHSLVAQSGEPDHPTFLTWSSGGFFVSEVSPFTSEQIAALTPDQLLTLLQEWKPDTDRSIGPERISREGFGAAVGDLVVQDISASHSYLNRLCLIHPVYTTAIVGRMAQTAKQGTLTPTDWLVSIELYEELLRHEEIQVNMERSGYVGWRDVRKGIVDLLEVAVDQNNSKLPAELLPRARDLLILLLNDPDPDRADDRPAEGWLGHGDPHTVALNHVRPEALAALIEYSLDVADQSAERQSGVGLARMEPEVRAALNQTLSDSSLAVHSVYGKYLMRLYWLDRNWLLEHLTEIFPEEDTEEAAWMYTAAWDAYVIFNHELYLALYETLLPHYRRAISNVKRGYITKTHLEPVKGLVRHLVFFYFQDLKEKGRVEAQSTLLYTFFEETGGAERGQAAWAFWRRCKEEVEKGKPAETWWPGARALWQYRVESATSQNFPSDFDPEMVWFSELLDIAPAEETVSTLWPLLQGTLPYVATTGFRHQVWESFEKFIARQVERDPIRSIELYTQMHDRSRPPSWSKIEEMRYILQASASKPESRRSALALLDTMARRGDLRLRDIYERYAL